MIVASHQPNFLPHIEFFHKMSLADLFVLSDDVLYSKSGMHNWNRVKLRDGVRRVSVPVSSHHNFMLGQIPLSDHRRAVRKLSATLRQGYSKSEHRNEGDMVVDVLELLSDRCHSMVELNYGLLAFLRDMFHICTPMVMASTIGIERDGDKDGRLVSICRSVGADTYLSGPGAAAYHDFSRFEDEGIDLLYDRWECPEYPHVWGWEPHMSVIDYVYQRGFEIPWPRA